MDLMNYKLILAGGTFLGCPYLFLDVLGRFKITHYLSVIKITKHENLGNS